MKHAVLSLLAVCGMTLAPAQEADAGKFHLRIGVGLGTPGFGFHGFHPGHIHPPVMPGHLHPPFPHLHPVAMPGYVYIPGHYEPTPLGGYIYVPGRYVVRTAPGLILHP